VHERDREHALLGHLHTLLDGGRHLLRLAVAHAHATGSVPNHDQGSEAEPPATSDDLGHAVDGHHPLLEGTLLGLVVEPPHVFPLLLMLVRSRARLLAPRRRAPCPGRGTAGHRDRTRPARLPWSAPAPRWPD